MVYTTLTLSMDVSCLSTDPLFTQSTCKLGPKQHRGEQDIVLGFLQGPRVPTLGPEFPGSHKVNAEGAEAPRCPVLAPCHPLKLPNQLWHSDLLAVLGIMLLPCLESLYHCWAA